MKRYGEEFEMDQNLMDALAAYMDEEIREKVHFELAPSSHEEFLRRYCELDPEWEDVTLKGEFGIEL